MENIELNKELNIEELAKASGGNTISALPALDSAVAKLQFLFQSTNTQTTRPRANMPARTPLSSI